MRKNRLIALIGTLTMAAAGLAAVGAGVSSNKADSVDAAGTQSKSTAYIYFEDQSHNNYWSYSDRPVYVRAYSLSFVDGFDKPTSSSDFPTVTNMTVYNSDSLDFKMTAIDGTGSDRKWELVVPWFIKTFTYQYHLGGTEAGTSWLGKSGTSDRWVRTIAAGKKHSDYFYNVDGQDYGGVRYGTMSQTDGTTSYSNNFTTYSVTKKNSDNTSIGSDTVLQYSRYNPANPTKTGYEFGGWFTDSACSSSFTTGTYIYSDTTIYAQWTANSYTVTFNANGGSVNPTSKQVAYDSTYGDLPTPENSGFSFDGWFTLQSGGSQVTSSSPVSITSNQTLWAHWTELPAEMVTATFYDGDGNIIGTNSVEKGSTPSYSGNTPTKSQTGQYTYTFNNTWSPALGPINEDTNFTAQFNSTLRSYLITWKDGDGGTLKTDTVNYGVTPTYNGPTPTKTATDQYTYNWNNGWSPAVTSVTGNAIYTATFNSSVNKYTLTWDFADGSTTSTTYTVGGSYDYGTPIIAPADNTMSKEGYNFTGWDTTPASTLTGNVKYTAQWSLKEGYYIVGLDNDWSTLKPEYYLTPYCDTDHMVSIHLDEGDSFKVVNYYDGEIKDWYGYATHLDDRTGSARAKNQIENDLSDNLVVKTGCAGDYLFAFRSSFDDKKIWISANYTITYKDKGNIAFSGVHDESYPTIHRYHTEDTLDTPTKDGYSFGGYFTTSDCSGNAITSLGKTNFSDDIKLYAKWISTAAYTITLDDNGGTGGQGTLTNVHNGDQIIVSTFPSRSNRIFAGYYTAASGGTKVINADGTNAVVYDDSFGTTLYAQWDDNFDVADGTYVWDVTADSLSLMSDMSGGKTATVEFTQGHYYKLTTISNKVRTSYVGYAGHVFTDCTTAFAHEQFNTTPDDKDNFQCLVTDTYKIDLIYDWDSVSSANKIKIYARYQVTWNSNGGSQVSNPSYKVNHGDKISYQSSTLDGYVLKGWNSGQTDNWDFDTWEVIEDTTLTAVWEEETHVYTMQVKTGESVTAIHTLIQNKDSEYMTDGPVSLTAGQVLAIYDNGELMNMNAKVVANNNCYSNNGETTVLVSKSDVVYVDLTNSTIFCGGFDAGTFYMVVTNSNGVDCVKLNKNATPQSDCDEYLTSGEYSFTQGDVISYINTGSNDGHIVPFDVATVDEASLNTNFETSGTKIVCNQTTNSFAYLKLGKEGKQGQNSVYFGNVDVQKAVDFAKKFVTEMNAVCKAPKDVEHYDYPWREAVGTKWAQLYAEYQLIKDNGAYNILKTATPESPYKAVAYFASFYDYVFDKYHQDHSSEITDFAHRFDKANGGAGDENAYSSSKHQLKSISDVSSSTWIIAVTAFIGIAAVGVFFIYRKRKEN